MVPSVANITLAHRRNPLHRDNPVFIFAPPADPRPMPIQLVGANGATLRTVSGLSQERKLNNVEQTCVLRIVSHSESPPRLSIIFLTCRSDASFAGCPCVRATPGFLEGRTCCPKSEVAKGAASRETKWHEWRRKRARCRLNGLHVPSAIVGANRDEPNGFPVAQVQRGGASAAISRLPAGQTLALPCASPAIRSTPRRTRAPSHPHDSLRPRLLCRGPKSHTGFAQSPGIAATPPLVSNVGAIVANAGTIPK
jgi:hypothetical protein